MILTALLFAAGAFALMSFWEDLRDWLKDVVTKVRKIINRVVIGFKIFVKKMGEAIKEIAKNYSQNEEGRWHETVVTREISESEVPADVLAKAKKYRGDEVDVTEELELKLGG
jgi:hypothetical protein